MSVSCHVDRALLGRPLDLYDVAHFDPQLGSQLERMWAALQAHHRSHGQQATPAPSAAAASGHQPRPSSTAGSWAEAAAAAPPPEGPPVLIDGMPVEDLCITFTLPGGVVAGRLCACTFTLPGEVVAGRLCACSLHCYGGVPA